MRTCRQCGKDISHMHINAKYCEECSFERLSLNEKVIKKPELLDRLEENIDYVKCKLCGYISRDLKSHIIYQHKSEISFKDYKEKYGKEAIYCESELKRMSEAVKGDKNPGYQHGGKLSPWSYNNKKLNKQEIDECKQKTIKSIKSSDNITTKFSYWLNLCNGDEKLAKKLYKERQSTFNLNKCIEKYGEEEGRKIWQERQNRWQQTLNSKSDEEKKEITRRKLSTPTSISKPEKELFSILKEEFPDIKSQFHIKKENGHIASFDFGMGRKLIEFNGEFFHASKHKYKANDLVFTTTSKNLYAKDIWERDKRKIDSAKKQGYDVLVIWEDEWNKNKQKEIDKCRIFLSNKDY